MTRSINPFDNSLIAEYSEDSRDTIIQKVEKANQVFSKWNGVPVGQRANFFRNAAVLLNKEKLDFAKLITVEMGKPIKEAIAEVEKCAWVCQFYADNINTFLEKEFIVSDASESYVSFEPLGVIFAIMPWNFPFWQVFRFAVPALITGNTAILKHASNTTGCALAIESIFKRSGIFEGVFQVIVVNTDLVESVISIPQIKAVTLTGSESAGSSVGAIAGKYLKKVVLELGGSDPFIVLEDADLDYAANIAVKSRFLNTGQSCIAAKRFIVEEQVYDAFIEKVKFGINSLRVGNPLDEETDIGPLARVDLAASVLNQVKESVSKGAKVILGGEKSDLGTAFLAPTLLVDVKKGMAAFDEEVFGPVMAVSKVISEDDAISLANDSVYGLGSSIWTKNAAKALELSSRIESGSVFINGMVKSDPRLPFGGIKRSGYGRELSHYGIKEFVNIKTVWKK